VPGPPLRLAPLLLLALTGCGGAATQPTTAQATKPPEVRTTLRLVERRGHDLPAAVQDAAPAPLPGGRVLLLGGLTPADTSTDAIVLATAGGSRQIGRLPTARHDAAAATLGRFAYLFGGGDGVRQLDEIVRVDPASGSAILVGRLPAGSSDSTAAAIGGTAYVVGGYTGTRWLDTILAWSPGHAARVVARLPFAVRYAAVTAADGKLVIAGGSLENGSASDVVLEYAPGSGRVVRIGRLPAPTTHAAAASLGTVAYVIGGRSATRDTPTGRIAAIAVRTRKLHALRQLRQPRSDLMAASVGGAILVAGGHAPGGTVAAVGVLSPRRVVVLPRRQATRQATPHTFSVDPTNVYAADRAGRLAPVARQARQLVYVPNSRSNTVDVIDPHTFRVIAHFAVGGLPQHVVPSWDLRRLWVTNDTGNSLTPIDPRTGKPGRPVPVDDPYNMYFTPDGRYAIVVAERNRRLDFRDAQTMRIHHRLTVPCAGVDHVDFSADGRYLLASCEFSGQLVKVDVRSERVLGTLAVGGMPQDVKLSPDGRVFYVADMTRGGLLEVDGRRLRQVGFLPTGAGTHGLYPSRDAKLLYVTNRGAGSISVVSFRTRKVVATWRIPGGGSPDMGGVSADGRVLWVSGRYNAVVYAISTRNGRLLARIPVGSGPHGLCVWPQPGRFSLGHTGILR
jgi:YVTN family beta-propeller protein